MPFLYKYRACSTASDFDRITSLLMGEFWFPLAREVNDPFEFRCAVDYGFSLEDSIKAFTIVETTSNPHIPRDDALKKVLNVFRGLSDDQIRARQWELSLDLWRRLASEVTMCCFSGTPTSTLLWSHYANGHTGVAVEVVPRGLLRCVTYPVEYLDDIKPISPLPLVDMRIAKKSRLFETLFLRKAACWAYEKEYRIMRKATAPHAQSFKTGSVRRVILGCAMPQDMRQKVAAWVRSNTSGVEVAVAVPSGARSYSLTIDDF